MSDLPGRRHLRPDRLALICVASISCSSASAAQQAPARSAPPAESAAPAHAAPAAPTFPAASPMLDRPLREVPPPRRFVTRHRVAIGGEAISFTATAGETYLYNDGGEPIGSIFSYAYIRDAPAASRRPVAFIFGGGPGSASAMLHVGGLGPWAIPADRLAIVDGQGPPVTPPYPLAENPDSLLDVADLVFVDPVGTGYSVPIGRGRGEDFWGIDEDADSLAQFIQRWITDHGRWDSPKFYIGESYGGTRAAPLLNALMGGPLTVGTMRGIAFNGVVVLVNTLGELSPPERAAMAFPGQAAAAWYHHSIDRAGRSLEAYHAEATRFAEAEYLPALRREADGSLAADDRARIVETLTRFTGLPTSAFAESLSLTPEQFEASLLAGRGRIVGHYDSRFTLSNAITASEPVLDDPALSHIFPVLSGALANLEHDRLGVDMDRPYSGIKWRRLLPGWNMGRTQVFPGVAPFAGSSAEQLALAMRRNEQLHLFLGAGYYDLLMPYAAAEYVARRTPFPEDRLVVRGYASGHEIYVGERAKLADDLRAFIRDAAR